MNQNYIREALKNKLERFLSQEIILPPFIYFFTFIYKHSNIEQLNPNDFYLEYTIAVFLALAFHFNFLFTITPFIQPSNVLASSIMLISCLLCCNQKWKVYIFGFSIGDSLIQQSLSNSAFITLSSCYICYQAYKNLLFRSIPDNIQYFAIFFSIACYFAVKLLYVAATSAEAGLWLSIPLIILTLNLGAVIIKQRIYQLRYVDMNTITHPRVMAHYLHIVQRQVYKEKFILKAKVEMHRRGCYRTQCFCRDPERRYDLIFFLGQLYLNAFITFPYSSEPLLLQFYCDFLFRNAQTMRAIHFLSCAKSSNYFMMSAIYRINGVVKQLIFHERSSNVQQNQYLYALQYDQLRKNMAIKIHEIIKLKQAFWKEVACTNPIMVSMQDTGSKIVKKMYELNVFYGKVSETYEKRLYSFEATILYGMYLLSTTNFKEYAETIIKKTAKKLEDVESGNNAIEQTFSIRIVVRNRHQSYLQGGQFLQDLKFEEGPTAAQYQLIIDAASSGLCKLLKYKGHELIGKELNTIVPDGYRQVHGIRLNNLFNFQSQYLPEVAPSKIIHKIVKMPMRTAKGELFMGLTCIRIMIDLERGLTFMSTVRRLNEKASTLLVNFEGQVTEKEEDFEDDVFAHSEVQKYIQIAKKSWLQNRAVNSECFKITVNGTWHEVTVGSPFLAIFLYKTLVRNKQPPIHVEDINEQKLGRYRKAIYKKNHRMTTHIKNLQDTMNDHKGSSTATSTQGIRSVNVLSDFIEGNYGATYSYIQAVFMIVIVCALILNIIGYLICGLQWQNSSAQGNPISETIKAQTLQLLTINSLLNTGEMLAYNSNQTVFNQTKLLQYIPPNDYTSYIGSIQNNNLIQLKNNLFDCLNNPSSLLQQHFNELWNTPINVTDPSITPTNTHVNSQIITNLQLTINYALDMNRFHNLNLMTGIMMYNTYSPVINSIQNVTYFSKYISNSIDSSRHNNIIVGLCLCGITLLTVIPMYFILRKRRELHLKIFDLIVSIDIHSVRKQLRSLRYISNILLNYTETSEVLKMNVIEYEDNIKMPRKRKSDVIYEQAVLGLSMYETNAGIKEKPTTDNDNFSVNSRISRNRQKTFEGRSSRTILTSTIDKIRLGYSNKKGSIRKRDGDLNLMNSQCDPDRICIGEHCVFYIGLVLFTIFLISQTYHNENYFNSVRDVQKYLISNYSGRIEDSLNFFCAKVYLRNGYEDVSILLTNEQAFKCFNEVIQDLPPYDYYYDDNMTNLQSDCRGFQEQQRICLYNYTYRVLQDEFFSMLKQLFEIKQETDQFKSKYTSSQYNEIIGNISQKIFYLQSINNKLNEVFGEQLSRVLRGMFADSEGFELLRLQILLLSFGWFLTMLVVGTVHIYLMKRQYFRQVYMITFLNTDMINKNKRVESYLQSLAKTN